MNYYMNDLGYVVFPSGLLALVQIAHTNDETAPRIRWLGNPPVLQDFRDLATFHHMVNKYQPYPRNEYRELYELHEG